MLLIDTANGIIKPGNDGWVFVIDHQPPVSWEDAKIEATDEGVYVDKSYSCIESIIKKQNVNVEHVWWEYLYWKDFPYPYTHIPNVVLKICKDLLKDVSAAEYSDEKNCFIMMNKRRENRLLVSAWFSQNKNIDFDYTQSWEIEDEHFDMVNEYTRLTPYKFNSFLEKKFIPFEGIDDPTRYDNGKSFSALWNKIFKEKFCSSTFSIITEPTFWEKGCLITEKYLMSVYGCCFPIFCGGYAMPEQLTRIGFDVFDDVIDHSYQYEAHPGLRVLNALELNRELLENHSVKKLDYMDRHQKNLSLIRENLNSFMDQFKFGLDQYNKYFSNL